MAKKNKSLRDLLLIHELAFLLLILLAMVAGSVGIHLWEKSSQETNRISALVSEVQQTRGDLYRQMKELFDAFFLEDTDAKEEYDAYTRTILQHFSQLEKLSVTAEEKQLIQELERNYQTLISEMPNLFSRYQAHPTKESRKALYDDIETGIFNSYETVSKRAENLLALKQNELNEQRKDTKQKSTILLIIPLIFAVFLLIFSRIFLKRAIVQPIKGVLQATAEISTGNLAHKVPEEGAEELVTVSKAINDMADKLITSQERLVRTEKHAAQGLLVPMLAHNIRNPLASIRATAQIMEDPAHDEDTRESLTGIISTVDRLERWTSALLAYLHPLRPQPTPTKMKDIIEGALSPLQQKIKEKDIHVDLPFWPRNDSIFTDHHLLEQVIYNLLLNAVDASKKGGVIAVALEVKSKEVVLQLLDRGCGMPFTPDPSGINLSPSTKRFGTGIGIPFAFKVCDILGGQLHFDARPEGGTIITITLPRTLNFS